MHVLLSLIVLAFLSAPAFAKFEPPPRPDAESMALKFARTCAHELDQEQGRDVLVRGMQHWLEVYLRDPDPALPSDHRLANTLLELYETAVDRLVDLPKSERERFRGFLEDSKLEEGYVPDVSDAEIFLSTLTEMNHELRRIRVPDLGPAAYAGIALTVMNGTLFHDEIRVGFENPDDLDDHHLVIEPDAHFAFTTVENTVDELRRGRALDILRSTVVAQFGFKPEAAFRMIRNLEYARGELPARIADRVDALVEWRKTFDGDETIDERVHEFQHIVAILNEINGYLKLADQMNRLGLPIWEGERVSPTIHYTDSVLNR